MKADTKYRSPVFSPMKESPYSEMNTSMTINSAICATLHR